jgi:hypothetical protein
MNRSEAGDSDRGRAFSAFPISQREYYGGAEILELVKHSLENLEPRAS